MALFLVGTQLNANAQKKPSVDEKTAKALVSAIQDEYKAKALYNKIIEKFGYQRPFSNIVQAEGKHIDQLTPLFAKYNITIPKNDWSDKLTAPDTMLEACKEGVDAEIENAKMYDEFLTFVKESDIKDIFIYLRDASRNNHLPAFQRCVNRGGEMGPGRGNGQGRGKGWGKGRGQGPRGGD